MSPTIEPLRRLIRLRGLWIGYWVALFVVMHVPMPKGSAPRFPGADLVVHLCLYFGLTWLCGICRTAGTSGDRSRDGRRNLAWALGFAAYAALDEWLQQFVGRTPDPADWAFDVLGVILATIVLNVRARRNAQAAEADRDRRAAAPRDRT